MTKQHHFSTFLALIVIALFGCESLESSHQDKILSVSNILEHTSELTELSYTLCDMPTQTLVESLLSQPNQVRTIASLAQFDSRITYCEQGQLAYLYVASDALHQYFLSLNTLFEREKVEKTQAISALDTFNTQFINLIEQKGSIESVLTGSQALLDFPSDQKMQRDIQNIVSENARLIDKILSKMLAIIQDPHIATMLARYHEEHVLALVSDYDARESKLKLDAKRAALQKVVASYRNLKYFEKEREQFIKHLTYIIRTNKQFYAQ